MNRETFVTLYKTRLFTVDQVVDIVESERDKVLDELEYYLSETAFQYGILSNVVVNLMQKKMQELRQAGE